MIEAESPEARASASGGTLQTMDMAEYDGSWSGDAQLSWRDAEVGDRLTLTIVAPETKEYSLEGYFTRSADYGDVRVLLAGRELAVIRGYATAGVPTGAIRLGRVHLKKGENFLFLELAGKDADLGGVALRPCTGRGDLPGGRAGAQILGLHRVGRQRRSSGS